MGHQKKRNTAISEASSRRLQQTDNSVFDLAAATLSAVDLTSSREPLHSAPSSSVSSYLDTKKRKKQQQCGITLMLYSLEY